MRLMAKTIIENTAKTIGIDVVQEISDTPTSILLPLPRIDFETLQSTLTKKNQKVAKTVLNDQIIIRKQTHENKLDVRCVIRIAGENENALEQLSEDFIKGIPQKIRQDAGDIIRIEATRADTSGFKQRIVDVLSQRTATIYISFIGGFYSDSAESAIKEIHINGGMTQ